MIYKDPLYGLWQLPDCIERLVHTKEMVRLRNITQAVLPNYLMPHGPIASRFQHGLGVARLADEVLLNNKGLDDYRTLLLVSGLLHDAGNPPLSHLGEHFLREITGKDGESFLEDILEGSETERVLKSLGLSSKEVVDFVTGRAKPISTVLNGSMDLDNLDNIGRYNLGASLGVGKFDALKIARSYKFFSNEWSLDASCYKEALKWKRARGKVYQAIYTSPHLNVAAMIYRACEIAFGAGKITRDFLFLDDDKAIEYLYNCGVKKTKNIIESALRWSWYVEVFCFETLMPSSKLKAIASDWKNRKILADNLASDLGVPEEQVVVYAGRGRDKRRITLPFVSSDGSLKHDNGDDEAIYRLKVYAPEALMVAKDCIHELVMDAIK